MKSIERQYQDEIDELLPYKRALENHLCEPDMADWLGCTGHDGKFCEVCEAADKRHYHKLWQDEQQLRLALEAVCAWEKEYRTINNLGNVAPSPFDFARKVLDA